MRSEARLAARRVDGRAAVGHGILGQAHIYRRAAAAATAAKPT